MQYIFPTCTYLESQFEAQVMVEVQDEVALPISLAPLHVWKIKIHMNKNHQKT